MKLEWKTCLKIVVSIFLLYLGIRYWPDAAHILATAVSAASPLIVGCGIAYFVNILMRFYERHYFPGAKTGLAAKSRRPVCMIAAFLTLLLIVILLINRIVPELISCIGVIISGLTKAIDALVDMLARNHILQEDIAEALNSIDWRSKVGKLLDILTNGAGTVVNAFGKSSQSYEDSHADRLCLCHLSAARQRQTGRTVQAADEPVSAVILEPECAACAGGVK